MTTISQSNHNFESKLKYSINRIKNKNKEVLIRNVFNPLQKSIMAMVLVDTINEEMKKISDERKKEDHF